MSKQTKGFSALLHPNFRRYFLAAVCATNATWIFRVLIAWTAWDLTQSTSFAGLVTTLMLLPVAIASPIFGVLIDRSDPVRTYFWVSVGYLLCPLFYVAAHYFDILQPWVLLLLACFYSLVVAVYQPLRQSLGPRLVDPDLIGSVMVLASLNHNTGRLVAPAVAGIGIATLGTEITSLMSIFLYVPSLLVAFALAPRPVQKQNKQARFWDDLVHGFVFAWKSWPIRQALLLGVFTFGPLTSLSEMLVLVADGIFSKGADGLGLMTSCIGIGALGAAGLQMILDPNLLQRTWLRLTLILLGIASGVVMVSVSSFEIASACAAVLGFTGIMSAVSLQAGMQAVLPDDMRGRVMALWMMAASLATAVCALGITTLAEFYGFAMVTQSVLVICAIAIVTVALIKHEG